MGIEPKIVTESEPISEIVKVTQPIGTKNVAGTQVNPATEDTLNDVYARILDVQQNVYSQLIGADETVAQSITLDVSGRTLLDIYSKADTATTFRLDCSNDNTNWITDYLTWAAVTEVKETHTNAFRYLRLKSDAAGVAGNLISLYLTGAR